VVAPTKMATALYASRNARGCLDFAAQIDFLTGLDLQSLTVV
jgi:hypothetical protein